MGESFNVAKTWTYLRSRRLQGQAPSGNEKVSWEQRRKTWGGKDAVGQDGGGLCGRLGLESNGDGEGSQMEKKLCSRNYGSERGEFSQFFLEVQVHCVPLSHFESVPPHVDLEGR